MAVDDLVELLAVELSLFARLAAQDLALEGL